MAMTKAERAEMEALRKDLRLARTRLFSGLPEPEPLPVMPGSLVNGWVMNSHGCGRAFKRWTDGNLSGDGWRNSPDRGFNSSRTIPIFYATERDALIALRLAKEQEVAKLLADLDARIAATEESAPCP